MGTHVKTDALFQDYGCFMESNNPAYFQGVVQAQRMSFRYIKKTNKNE